MADPRSTGLLSGPAIMLLSAALFGYFGFFMGMTATTGSGQTVFFFGLLLWTLRIAAVGFVASAVLTMVQPMAGNLLYALVGLASAVGLALVGIMDIIDKQNGAALPPILAFLFAAWNGWGAWSGLQGAMAARRITQYDRPARDH